MVGYKSTVIYSVCTKKVCDLYLPKTLEKLATQSVAEKTLWEFFAKIYPLPPFKWLQMILTDQRSI